MTSPLAKSVGDFGPAFSPDGRFLAFVRLVGYGASDLYLLTLSNDLKPIGEPMQITFNNWSVHNPVWTPDGREIIFSSDRGGGFSLWRIAASAAGKPQRLASVGEGADELAISHQGRLVYARSVYDTNIWRLQVPGSQGKATPPMNFISSTHWDDTPQFSPDGPRIAFSSGRSGSGEIWVCDSDGSDTVQLTSSLTLGKYVFGGFLQRTFCYRRFCQSLPLSEDDWNYASSKVSDRLSHLEIPTKGVG